MPEVSLVAIIDADKEGFLRSHRSLTQTVGRAARNVNGKAIMYADKITKSMQKTIDETNYRRTKQTTFNRAHNLTPTPLKKFVENPLVQSPISSVHYDIKAINQKEDLSLLSRTEIDKRIREKRKAMEKAAKDLDFIQAAKLRDEIKALQEL